MVFTSEQKQQFESMYRSLALMDETDGKLVQVTDTMLQLMVEAGEAQVRHIHCKRIVPHVSNRNATLMPSRKVFQKGAKILGVGFSLPKCGPTRAVAFQANPTDFAAVDRFVKHANADPHFASFSTEAIEACSVGCGHLNQMLACIHDEVEVPAEFRADKDLMGSAVGEKKLDKNNICKRDGKDLAAVLEKGLQWTHVPYSFEKQFPKLPALFAQALNVEHHIGEGESWDEQFNGIAKAIVEHYNMSGNANKPPNYDKIVREVLRAKPPRAADVESHVSFCKKWGGGKSQTFSLDICRYIKMKSEAKIVSNSLFTALANMNMHAEELCPHFIAAVVKCAAVRGKGRNGVSIHITEGDVKGLLTHSYMNLERANSLIKKACALQASLGDEVFELRGDMECDIVDFVMKKVALPTEAAETDVMGEIVEKFIGRVSGNTRGEELSDAKATESKVQTIFDPTGSVGLQTVQNLGWVVGGIVREKLADGRKPEADKQFEIGYINENGSAGLFPIGPDGVCLNDQLISVSSVDLTKKYKTVPAKQRLSNTDAPKDATLGDGIWSAAAILGINVAYATENKFPRDRFYLQLTPTQRLIASTACDLGEIALVPWTQSVKLLKENKGNAAGLVVGVADHNKKDLAKFSVEKPDSKTAEIDAFLFWKLRRVSEQKLSPEVNQSTMHMETVEVKVPMPKLGNGMPKHVLVTVPMAVLSTTIEKGSELVLHMPGAKRTAGAPAGLLAVCEPVVKKAKV